MKLTQKILAMYLGCDCWIDGHRGYVQSLDDDGAMTAWFPVDHPKYGKALHLLPGDPGEPSMQLILRKLEGIKLEEAAHCLQQTFFDHVTYPMNDYKLKLNDYKNPVISIDNNWWSHNLTFGNRAGSIWSCGTKSENVKIPASVYTYLIWKRFDLFGLIPDGYAIDAASLSLSEGEPKVK